MYWTEELMYGPVSAYFRSLGYRVYREAKVARRWVDLLAVGREIVAVELKIRDWRGALKQAMSYQLGTHYALVAMPLDHVFPAMRSRHLFEREGVGLMAVNSTAGNVRILIEPQASPRLLPFVLDGVLSGGDGISGRPTKRKRIPVVEIRGFSSP
jgi:hypothetical protein